jgi:hypothetical protein
MSLSALEICVLMKRVAAWIQAGICLRGNRIRLGRICRVCELEKRRCRIEVVAAQTVRSLAPPFAG